MSGAFSSPAPNRFAESWLSLLFGFVGGYADAASYLLLKSFTGHITGNSILGAISLLSGDGRLAGLQLWAVICFLAGTVGTLRFERQPRRLITVRTCFVAEALLVAAAALILYYHWPAPRLLSLSCLGVALGIQNGAVTRIQGNSVHTTFTTGLFTKLANRAFGDSELTASDARVVPLLALAFSFLAGAVAGAFFTMRLHSLSLLAPALLVAVAAGGCSRQLQASVRQN